MVETVGKQPPFFTIGVPTYNRNALLKKTLESILAQSFSDFEVIVGNDYTNEILAGEILGITDPRVHFINHTANLREVGNMNNLLSRAHGHYFTWLFDDDLFEPDFLMTAHKTLTANGYPDAFFSSYRLLIDTVDPEPLSFRQSKPVLLSGKEFIRQYKANRPEIISTCGLYRTDILKKTLGGFTALTDSVFGLYSEYLLLVSCGLLKSVAFINSPLVIFRIHSESWGETNFELETYPIFGRELIIKCAEILRNPKLIKDSQTVLLETCKIHLFTYYRKSVLYELAHNNSKISRAIRYRFRYYCEIIKIWKLYSELTGIKPLNCITSFLQMVNHYHIFPPTWDKQRTHND